MISFECDFVWMLIISFKRKILFKPNMFELNMKFRLNFVYVVYVRPRRIMWVVFHPGPWLCSNPWEGKDILFP